MGPEPSGYILGGDTVHAITGYHWLSRVITGYHWLSLVTTLAVCLGGRSALSECFSSYY